MDINEFEGKWKLIRGQSKVWWSRITDADLEAVERAGIKYFKYVTLVQSRYGYDRQIIKDAIDKHVAEYEAGLKINGAATS
jgi:uncharacterized protein YjbJ (UPF0337 family)